MATETEALLGAALTSIRGVRVERITVQQPGDDDNLWFVRTSLDGPEVQIEGRPDGGFPILIEGHRPDQVMQATSVEVALRAIRMWLGLEPT